MLSKRRKERRTNRDDDEGRKFGQSSIRNDSEASMNIKYIYIGLSSELMKRKIYAIINSNKVTYLTRVLAHALSFGTLYYILTSQE